MKFNSDGKLARFYLFCSEDGAELPQNLCSYFWGLVSRALFIVVLGSSVLLAVFGILFYVAVWFWAHKKGVAIVLGAGALFGLVMWLSERKVKIEILSEAKAVIKGKVDAVKGRYCPRIEWD